MSYGIVRIGIYCCSATGEGAKQQRQACREFFAGRRDPSQDTGFREFVDARLGRTTLRPALRRLMQAAGPAGGPRVILGTHDRRLISELTGWATGEGIPSTAYEFHLLYGIGRDEQRRLRAAGHRVRVLISYGSAWFPWYMRRLAERPANVWFVIRSLFSH